MTLTELGRQLLLFPVDNQPVPIGKDAGLSSSLMRPGGRLVLPELRRGLTSTDSIVKVDKGVSESASEAEADGALFSDSWIKNPYGVKGGF